ncbi:ORC-CDC6 family AAA ATPase [Yoonia vestfoldensis]|uniref:ORC-CDC6 family AAA ATPase n=1 Tax=Yoonia vestfoldensis TaxID=245188 RepID=UPI000370AE59|nr:hypothetical protein [Yoonia vestfoldensis]
MNFSDPEILNLFGAEAAEDETPEKLKSFFFKSDAYESIRSDLPLRVLVGNKGSGKSALLSMSHYRDNEKKVMSLRIQPNDVHNALRVELPIIQRIEELKIGIAKLVFEKSINRLVFRV